jgi:Cu(I)/Ag(I) efflux system membrane fusion protein
LPSILAFLALALALGNARADEDASDPVRIVDATTLELTDGAMANLSVTSVSEQDVPDVLSIMGTIGVVENKVTSVPARVAGRIDAVLKVSGEYVHAGDAVALEYSPDFIATRQEYLEALKKDAGSAGLSPTADTDFSNLAAISRKKLENMGLIAKDIADLPNSGGDGHLVIRASRDGAITYMNTSVGNMQNQGDTLMTVSDLAQVWFSGDLYSEDLGKVHAGQKIQIQTEGLSKPLPGEISFISPVIDPNAHTIKIRARISNPDRVLRGGMVVQGDVVLSHSTALVVPETALMNLHNTTYCFKKIGANRFKEIPVKVAHEYAGLATVTDGLEKGDEVVSAGGLVLDYAFQGD